MFHYPFNYDNDLYTMNTIDEFIEIATKDLRLQKSNNNKKPLFNYAVPCAFDIETSNLYYDSETGEQLDFHNTDNHDLEKFATMYIWQFGLNGYVIIGRSWKEFITLLQKISSQLELSEHKHLICYVHNLSFEFQFMGKWLDWINVFATKDRYPVKALCTFGIEFRDSLILSALSLDLTAKQLTKYKVQKLTGYLDYDLPRNCMTELTKDELKYCVNDVLVVMCYIQEQLEENYNVIANIPLTNTGRVRRYCKKMCFYNGGSRFDKNNLKEKRLYRMLMKSLTISDEYELQTLKWAFAGGHTHANVIHVNKLLHNVASQDITSDYPYQFFNFFPMSSGEKVKIETLEQLEELISKYHLVFTVKLFNVRSVFLYENIISVSKCHPVENAIENNGRLVSCDSCVITITEIDYLSIRRFYIWDKMQFGLAYKYDKGILPINLLKSVLNLYKQKTTLKGFVGKTQQETEEKARLYLKSKGMLNSVYGMSVTDIIHDEITFNGEEWNIEKADLTKSIEKYNNDSERFLYYIWGIYITAYARQVLYNAIYDELKADYVYADTDSLKYVNPEKHVKYFERYNKYVEHKLKVFAKLTGIPFDDFKPKDIKGNEHLLGAFTYEGTYLRFKTLGAKRYMYDENGEIITTIAGLSKKKGKEYLIKKYGTSDKVFNAFNNSLYVPETETGKLIHTYIDYECCHIVTDYKGVSSSQLEKSFIHLSPCAFDLSIGAKFADYIMHVSEVEDYNNI